MSLKSKKSKNLVGSAISGGVCSPLKLQKSHYIYIYFVGKNIIVIIQLQISKKFFYSESTSCLNFFKNKIIAHGEFWEQKYSTTLKIILSFGL